MVAHLSRNWWMIVIRGVLAILFGLMAFFWPRITVTALILLFGAYVLLDGIFAVGNALSNRSTNRRWWVLLLEGLAGIAAGILTFVWPGITGLVLLFFIAAWAIVTGVLEVIAAFQLRAEIANEVWLALGGLLYGVFGLVILLAPRVGALAVLWLIAAYAILFGLSFVALGLRLRNQVIHIHRRTTTAGRAA